MLSLLRSIATIVLVGSTLVFFLTIDSWERTRPTSPDPAHHFTILHKGASRLVYISGDDQLFKNWSLLIIVLSFVITFVTVLATRKTRA